MRSWIVLSTVLFLGFSPDEAPEKKLIPGEGRGAADELRARGYRYRPPIRATRGVVAAGNPLSAMAGMRILEHGGNVVDAGVAAMLAAATIEQSHFGFGG